MRLPSRIQALSDTRGQTLVEFSLVSLVMVMLMVAVVDMSRMILVYTTIANAARVGARYAMVHGSDSTVSPQVTTYVAGFLHAGTVNSANTTVLTTYPSSGNCTSPGCQVRVSVSYPYYALTKYFPFHVTLTSTSQGVITY